MLEWSFRGARLCPWLRAWRRTGHIRRRKSGRRWTWSTERWEGRQRCRQRAAARRPLSLASLGRLPLRISKSRHPQPSPWQIQGRHWWIWGRRGSGWCEDLPARTGRTRWAIGSPWRRQRGAWLRNLRPRCCMPRGPSWSGTDRLHEGNNADGVRMRCGIIKSELEGESSMLWFGGYPPDVTEGFSNSVEWWNVLTLTSLMVKVACKCAYRGVGIWHIPQYTVIWRYMLVYGSIYTVYIRIMPPLIFHTWA